MRVGSKMAALAFGMIVATLAGIAGLNFGYGPLGALVIYSIAGHGAMMLFAGTAALRNWLSGTDGQAFASGTPGTRTLHA
jgi:hypothetical protein